MFTILMNCVAFLNHLLVCMISVILYRHVVNVECHTPVTIAPHLVNPTAPAIHRWDNVLYFFRLKKTKPREMIIGVCAVWRHICTTSVFDYCWNCLTMAAAHVKITKVACCFMILNPYRTGNQWRFAQQLKITKCKKGCEIFFEITYPFGGKMSCCPWKHDNLDDGNFQTNWKIFTPPL